MSSYMSKRAGLQGIWGISCDGALILWPANSRITCGVGHATIPRTKQYRQPNTNRFDLDEISMSSLRILHIVDQLHQKVRNNPLPFGVIQVILAGEFCQLKPIPNLLDAGEPIYKSILFDNVFPQSFF